jgi:hypothetical protein
MPTGGLLRGGWLDERARVDAVPGWESVAASQIGDARPHLGRVIARRDDRPQLNRYCVSREAHRVRGEQKCAFANWRWPEHSR